MSEQELNQAIETKRNDISALEEQRDNIQSLIDESKEQLNYLLQVKPTEEDVNNE